MRKFVLAAVLVLMASSAQAATLNVVGGQLMGASGVLVDGSLYDVQFLDGTCIDLYNGCDVGSSDFTFQTEASALLASQALFDQVFLDGPSGNFNSDPALTSGCSLLYCNVNTPFSSDGFLLYGHPGTQGWVAAIVATVSASASVGYLSGVVFDPFSHLDTRADGNEVFARWSAVPEPSTALLLGLGLTGLGAKGRRRSRS